MLTELERFWGKVDKNGPFCRKLQSNCWVWTGHKSYGYGSFRINNQKSIFSHRYSYILLKGPIAPGMTIDHLCYNQACCNPDHLEAVTSAENTHRAFVVNREIATELHLDPSKRQYNNCCGRGHELTDDNVVFDHDRVHCKKCLNIQFARNRCDDSTPLPY